jgi:hypothetical protein
MKKTILVLFCLAVGGAVLVFAWRPLFVDRPSIEGVYAYTHTISLAGEKDRESCEGSKGDWDEEQQACFFSASDSAIIKRTQGKYQVEISTVATNGHNCGFVSEEVKNIAENMWLATAREKAEKDGSEIMCEVEIEQLSSDALSVKPRSSSGCLFFCGARASLVIDRAMRVD